MNSSLGSLRLPTPGYREETDRFNRTAAVLNELLWGLRITPLLLAQGVNSEPALIPPGTPQGKRALPAAPN